MRRRSEKTKDSAKSQSARKRAVGALLALAAAAAFLVQGPARNTNAFDHRDGPILVNTAVNGTHDLNDLYVFRSPANPSSNTVFVLTFQPFPGNLTPISVDPTQQYDIKIDTTGDAIEDIVFRITFGPPDANGVQDVMLLGLPAAMFPPTGILARGKTGTTAPTGVNIPVEGGGTFRAGIHDDPFFFDAGGFNTLESTGAGFPRAPGTAHNFFGPNGNTFACILEIPSSRILFPATNPNKIIGVFATITQNGTQVDFVGRGGTNTALIPPSPRKNLARGERRNAFNAAQPRNHRAAAPAGFRDDMIFVLTDATGFFKRNQTDASFLANALLPDLLMFQIGNPGGYGTLVGGAGSPGFFGTGPFAGGQVLGNGRQFRDDVLDILFNLLTNGAIPSDNVGDDNGLKITDGSVDPVSAMTRAIAFPYIGLANLPLNGPGTGPNP
jgi:hypothetical protein